MLEDYLDGDIEKCNLIKWLVDKFEMVNVLFVIGNFNFLVIEVDLYLIKEVDYGC